MSLTAGQVVEYKYIKSQSQTGRVAWESDPNHTYTVPKTCATAAVQAGQMAVLMSTGRRLSRSVLVAGCLD